MKTRTPPAGTVRTVTSYRWLTPADIAQAALSTAKHALGGELLAKRHSMQFIIALDASGFVITNSLQVGVPGLPYGAPVARMNLDPETLAKLRSLRERLLAE